MVKVVTVMTERYGKVLRRGKRDRVKLLFRSMAVFDRRSSPTLPTSEKPTMEQLVAEQKPDDMVQEVVGVKELRSQVAGFAIDEPANDDPDEEEDDDELALAALDSLDAIEVFKEDQRVAREKKIHNARIPVENLKRLLMLLLVLAPLEPQENMARYVEVLSETGLEEYEKEVDSIVASFDPDGLTGGIRYAAFTRAISTCFPLLFDPFNALFEHFLFSKNIDVSRHQTLALSTPPPPLSSKISPILSGSSTASSILTPALLSHLSTFLMTQPSSTSPVNLFHAGTRFHPVYSTTTQGTSLTSFSRHVMSWQSTTLLLITGTPTQPPHHSSTTTSSTQTITIGAFLPTPWSKPGAISSSDLQPLLFLLSPRHALFPHNPSNHNSASIAHFGAKTGIALGCIIPPSSRTNSTSQTPILGPVSLRIDADLSTAIFQHDAEEGVGAFLPDPGLEQAQMNSHATRRERTGESRIGTSTGLWAKKIAFDIDTLEVWGVTHEDADAGEEGNEVLQQQKRMEWEEREAARRAAVNFGGDRDGARALLEMAGLVGDRGRSGGSA